MTMSPREPELGASRKRTLPRAPALACGDRGRSAAAGWWASLVGVMRVSRSCRVLVAMRVPGQPCSYAVPVIMLVSGIRARAHAACSSCREPLLRLLRSSLPRRSHSSALAPSRPHEGCAPRERRAEPLSMFTRIPERSTSASRRAPSSPRTRRRTDRRGHRDHGDVDEAAHDARERPLHAGDHDDHLGLLEHRPLVEQAMDARDAHVVNPVESDPEHPHRLGALLGDGRSLVPALTRATAPRYRRDRHCSSVPSARWRYVAPGISRRRASLLGDMRVTRTFCPVRRARARSRDLLGGLDSARMTSGTPWRSRGDGRRRRTRGLRTEILELAHGDVDRRLAGGTRSRRARRRFGSTPAP